MSRKCRNATDRIGGETAILRQQSRHSVRLADHPRTGLTVITRAFWRSDRFSVCVPRRTHKALTPCGDTLNFASSLRAPRFWTPAQTNCVPLPKKLTTSHWESAGVRHASGKCEPHPQRIPQKELEAMYLYVKWNRFWFSPTAGLLKHMLRISGHSVSFG